MYIYYFKERLGLGGPREDSMWMLCLPLGYGSPMGGCRRNHIVKCRMMVSVVRCAYKLYV